MSETVVEPGTKNADTEQSDVTRETEAALLNGFPEVVDPFPGIMWGKVVENISRLFEIQRQENDTDRPDTKALGDALKNGKTGSDEDADKELAKRYSALVKGYDQLREKMAVLRKDMNRVILEANGLSVEDDTDEEDLKAEFKSTQKLVKNMLDTIGMYATENTIPEVVSFVDKAKAAIPGGKSGAINPTKASGTKTASNSHANKIREWARANGYKVNERGRLAAEVVAAYNKANPAPTA